MPSKIQQTTAILLGLFCLTKNTSAAGIANDPLAVVENNPMGLKDKTLGRFLGGCYFGDF